MPDALRIAEAVRPPVVGADWGLHITEMMAGAAESYTTGKRYEMATTLDD